MGVGDDEDGLLPSPAPRGVLGFMARGHLFFEGDFGGLVSELVSWCW